MKKGKETREKTNRFIFKEERSLQEKVNKGK